MGKADNVAVTTPVDTAVGTVIEVNSKRKYVSKLVPKSPQSINLLFFLLAGTISGVFAGSVCDWRGRRETMLWSGILIIIGALVQGFAQNIGMFVAARIIIGVANGLTGVGAGAYLGETVALQWRAFVLGFYWDCWFIGSLVAAGVTFGTKNIASTWAWRLPSLLQVVPGLFAIAILPFLPESPRWLAYHDRSEDALEVLAVCHASGDLTNQAVRTEYIEIMETLAFEKIAGSVSPSEMFRTPGNRKRIFLALSVAVFAMTLGNNIVTFYLGTILTLAGVTNQDTQLKINIILSVFALACAFTGTLFCDKLGRRNVAIISTCAATIFLYLVGGLSALYSDGKNTSGSYATVAMIFLFQGAYSWGWTPLTILYPVEVLNYSTRATGMGLYTFLSYGMGLMITFAFPYAFDAIGYKTYLINATFNVVTLLVVIFFWVETRGRSLEEIDVLMDGVKHSDTPDVLDVMQGKAAVVV